MRLSAFLCRPGSPATVTPETWEFYSRSVSVSSASGQVNLMNHRISNWPHAGTVAFACLAVLAGLCSQMYAAPGGLDAGFGTHGKIEIPSGPVSGPYTSLKVLKDGRILLSRRYTGAGFKPGIALQRLTSDGQSDGAFGQGGATSILLNAGELYGEKVAETEDGSYLVAGHVMQGNYTDNLFARFNANGALDVTFGNAGLSVVSLSFGNDRPRTLFALPGGGFLCLGTREMPVINPDTAISRYTATGALDLAFGTNGVVGTSFFDDDPLDVAQQADGKLVVAIAETDTNLNSRRYFLQRRELNGALDGSFGNAGTLALGDVEYTVSVSVTDNGGIYVLRRSLVTGDTTLNRLRSDGTADLDWANGGRLAVDPALPSTKVLRDGRIVMWGSGNGIIVVKRLNSDGSVDVEFGTNGTATIPVGGAISYGVRVEEAAEGKLLLGAFLDSPQTFMVARLLGEDGPPQPAVVTAVALKGDPAALAGLDPDVPTGSVWTSFGSPALGDNGAIVFAGKWKHPGVAVAGAGLFLLSPGGDVLVARVGGDVPGVAGATWKSFRAPSLDSIGETVVFLATIQGASVTSGDDTVLAAKVAGFPLTILAREGGEAPETGGALFKSFSSVLPADGWLVLDAKLAAGTGSPPVSPLNDRAVFEYGARNEFQGLAYREGDVRPWMNPGETLKSYNFLQPTPGSPGHGRGLYSTWALSSQRKALTDLHGHLVILTGEPGFIPSLPAAKIAAIGAPSEVMRLALVPGFGGVTVANRTGIFGLINDGLLEPYLRTGDPAPGVGPGVGIHSLRDQVWNGGIAFQGVAKGGTVNSGNNDGIWWTPPGIPDWRLVAREGEQPPAAPAGAQWKSFTSLALPGGGRGPLFAARLRTNIGGITAADDGALYGTGSDGIVRELIRENQPLAGRTVRTFSTLNTTSGSAGVTRQFNSAGKILASVTFTDGSTGIVKIALP